MGQIWAWVTFSVLVIDAVVRLIVAIAVIYRRRPVPVTLAWLLLLAFLPIISTFVYLLVGENRLGSRRAARYEGINRRIAEGGVALWHHKHTPTPETSDGFDHIARFGTAVAGLPPLRGNTMTLIPDNDTMLEGLIRDIDSAQHHVHLLYYIWTLDSGGERVAEATIRAAQRGVQCRVLVDGVGGWGLIGSALWNRMLAAGVQCVEALPVNVFRRPFSRLDLRNHRKIAVFDGRIAYCGSQNIHDTTFRAKKWRDTGQWIDASVRVEGPAAQALGLTFLKDWQLDSEENLSKRLGEFLPPLTIGPDADCVVQVIPSGPGPTPTAIHQAFLTLIYSAREELVMATPYFVPDEATLAALIAAASRGVRVTLVMPKVSDSMIVAAASRSHYLDLLEAGVNIHHYTKGLLHAKTLTIDRKVGLIGSANFDSRSFFLNFEITLLAYDQDFASRLRHMQLEYLRSSYEVHLPEWRKRAAWQTMLDNMAQLMGPLL
jgi:cardiolipin synthase A/B